MNRESVQSSLPHGRQAGVCLHITSLPGPYGIGEIGAAARHFIDQMVSMELSVWQFLPLGPTAYGDSPYQPLSTFAGNEMLVDIGNLVDLGLLDDDEVAELTTLPERYVDYGALIPIKNRLLYLAASRFEATVRHALLDDFGRFLERNDAEWLHDYALFRILKTRHGERPWPEWQAEYVHRDASALARLENREAARLRGLKIIQYLFFRQWFELRDYAHQRGITLFGDMPICIALDSSDAWANREMLRLDEDGRPDAVAGVPPDYFSEDGQLWGNPLYDWDKHEADGYSWWVDRLRATSELTDLVRIDHFRGFEAYWSIPADAETARTGAWEPGPGDAIFDAMRAALGNLPIVAENLGVITPEVEDLRERHGIPGMYVLQFDVCDPEFRLEDVADNSVCYTGTHDNDTTIGWFHGSPDDIRGKEEIQHAQRAVLQMTGGTAETVHTDLIRAAFSTPARLAIAPLQDYLGLGSEARTNVPGTPGGNWRWRVIDTQLSDKFCDNVASLVIISERGISCHGASNKK
ncbi:MAG: 4-alpha-glucanotransferase [Gammaproteobacteria bacterium]|nr:4-alpha-glucanotransferase [Gammaproteobacteria bacterium]NNF48859.1 4-alpha-glucanotransferase [Woeseiaceae bacterium]MBT8094708.1 4-alpha-glucanotransferase [Gammaproteobacteria bacterium]MBT8104329.1 4-alpha-glucanotransferase [Gammaproteobacteria bacterium]NNK24345.1 4-alpha-glucanotransferase [Woeseiaceae bacterium]